MEYTTELLCNHGLKNVPDIQQVADVWIYPHDYFAPKNVDTKKLVITENTRSIHHYDASWADNASRAAGERAPKLRRYFGARLGNLINASIYGLQQYGFWGSIKRVTKRR